MNEISVAIRREFRVAFSRRAQPVWFRIVKWAFILMVIALFHERPWFWRMLAGLAGIGLIVHFYYRWKTKVWRRAWGGWSDLEAGRD
jgi:hypothetical protein